MGLYRKFGSRGLDHDLWGILCWLVGHTDPGYESTHIFCVRCWKRMYREKYMTTCNACQTNNHEDCRGGKDGCSCYEDGLCSYRVERDHFKVEHLREAMLHTVTKHELEKQKAWHSEFQKNADLADEEHLRLVTRLRDAELQVRDLQQALRGALEFYADGDGDAAPPWVVQARGLLVGTWEPGDDE